MIELLKILLSLSLSGALLILVLLLCKPLYKNRLSRQWQYYIWLIVIARLLLPFTPETSLVGNLFREVDSAIVQISTSEPTDSRLSPETDFAEHDTPPKNQADMTTGESPEPEKTLVQRVLETAAQNIWLICVLVWLMVAVGLLIRKATIYQSFVKYINAGRMEVTDMRLWEQLGKLVEQAGVKRTVELYTNSLISSPLLIGFLHPCIMLPSAELSDSDLKNTILHELTHYKRRDMFYKWLVQVTICFHWFNPCVYFMGKEINRACEFSCDEAVIRTFDKGAQRAYGDTLLNALNQGGQYKVSLGSVTLNENTEILKERLDVIMHFKKNSRMMIAITIVITIFFCMGSVSVGAYAGVNPQGNNLPPNEKNITTEEVVFTLKGDWKSGIHKSSSFEAGEGQTLSLEIQSSINGGSVDFFLFSPNGQEKHYTFGSKGTQNPIIIPLSSGRWAYNCSGVFDTGAITIVGRVSEKNGENSQVNPLPQNKENGTTEKVVFTLKGDWKSGIHESSSFEAGEGQTLTLEIESSINGGSVDFFLFSPNGQEKHYTFGSKGMQNPIIIPLSSGRWAYNCSGVFDTGAITIVGWVSETKETNNIKNESMEMETFNIGDKIYYWVENETQLRSIGQGKYSLDKNYIQAADIHMSTDEWIPIGTEDKPFTGSYCGNGCEIIGLTMTDPNAKIIGLFGVADGANIYNITMRDYDIQSAGRNVTGKSIAPILALGLGDTRSYDNQVYPKEK